MERVERRSETVISELSGTEVSVQLLRYLRRRHRPVKSGGVRAAAAPPCPSRRAAEAGVRQEGRDAPDRPGQVLLFEQGRDAEINE